MKIAFSRIRIAAVLGAPTAHVVEGTADVRVRLVDDLRAALAKAQPGSNVLARVRRSDVVRFVAVPIPGNR